MNLLKSKATQPRTQETNTFEMAAKIIGDYYIYYMSALILFQLFLILNPLSLRIIFITGAFSVLIFSLISPLSNDRMKELSYVGFKISMLLLLYNGLMYLGMIIDRSEFSVASMKPIMFLLSTLFSLVIVNQYVKRETRNKVDENLLKLQGLEFIRGKKKADGRKGDVVLCENIDTEQKVILPFKDRFLHMLVLGPTGSGKTSQIIIPMINQDMQNLDYGVTVIEPKGDLAERVYAMANYYGREAVYFNPTHPDCPYFNPLYGDESEVIENMATTFKMLSASEKSNPFFDNMNENLIRNALKLLKRLKGNSATLVDLSTIVYNSQGQGKIMVNQFARVKTNTVEEAKENGDIASWFLSDYYNERSKTYEHCSGLRSQVSKITSNVHLRRVLNPPDGRNDVNFGDFIEEGKVLAISTAQGDLRDLGRFLGYFIILNFQSAVFKRPGNEDTRRPHFLYIDEFQTYSNPGFADMLTQGRSYRVASHLATQNRALMAMGGGKDGSNFVELVSTNARNVVLFPGGNSKDAKYYSDEFGEALKKKREKSINRSKFNLLTNPKKINAPSESIRETEQMGSRFSPSDLIYRPFGEVSYRIVENNTVQAPGIGKIAFIPKALNDTLTQMIEDYHNGVDISAVNEVEDELETSDGEIIDLMDQEPMDVVISFDEVPKRGNEETDKKQEDNLDDNTSLGFDSIDAADNTDDDSDDDVIDFDIDLDLDDGDEDMDAEEAGEIMKEMKSKEEERPVKKNEVEKKEEKDEPVKDILDLDYSDFDDLI